MATFTPTMANPSYKVKRLAMKKSGKITRNGQTDSDCRTDRPRENCFMPEQGKKTSLENNSIQTTTGKYLP